MSTKAENISRYSSSPSWRQFLIRHPLLLKVVTWLSSLSLLASANVSWAEVKPLEITASSAAPVLVQSQTLPIVSSSQPWVNKSESSPAQVNAAHRKLHADLLTAKNLTVSVQGNQYSAPAKLGAQPPTAISCNNTSSQLVSSLCSQVRPQGQKAAVAPRPTPAVSPLPVVSSVATQPRLAINNRLAATSYNRPAAYSQLTAPKPLAPRPAVQLAKPQALAPLAIPGAVSIYVAPPRTSVIPSRTVEPLSAIPSVNKPSVPTLAPLPVVQPRAVAQAAPNNVSNSYAADPQPLANYQVADGLIYPLASPAPMTSRFGWRVHPITGNRRFHAGVDIGAPTGAAVVAAATGRVVVANWHGGYGKAVVIEHNGKLQTLYGHLSEILVQEGQEIRQGTVIGRVGSTGNSTGPHLHFETHAATNDGWVAVDPGPEVRYALDNLRQAMQYSRRDVTSNNY